LPVTAKEFGKPGLAYPRTEERSHMNHPDFRVCGKIFATLGYPDKAWAVVKLTPEQQEELDHDEPGMFAPVKGARGGQGATNVQLKSATTAALPAPSEPRGATPPPRSSAPPTVSPLPCRQDPAPHPADPFEPFGNKQPPLRDTRTLSDQGPLLPHSSLPMIHPLLASLSAKIK
jgi:hypothetical protein